MTIMEILIIQCAVLSFSIKNECYEIGLCLFVSLVGYSQERSNVGEYNILDYGAKKDSSFLSSEAINQAITDCSANGGGRVVIPAGKYKSGTILMKDYVELYFEPGSYLYASIDPKDICRQPQPEYRSEKE